MFMPFFLHREHCRICRWSIQAPSHICDEWPIQIRLGIGWEYNIKMEFMETGCEDVKGNDLAQEHIQWQILILAVWNVWVLIWS
jgi:hypothetical protein